MSGTSFVPEHAKRVALSMIIRYGGVGGALRVCQDNIHSPHTEPAGKKFWEMVDGVLRKEREAVGTVGSTAHAGNTER